MLIVNIVRSLPDTPHVLMATIVRGYQPVPRFWHTSLQIGSQVIVHSGVTREYSKTKQSLANAVDIFDPYEEQWKQTNVTGQTPTPGVRKTASASIKNDLFMFGGETDGQFYNSLHRLRNCSHWVEVCSQNTSTESPMAKCGAGMVAFGNNLAVFGGYGIPHGPTQPGSFIKDTRYNDGGGWTNELHIYNLNDGV